MGGIRIRLLAAVVVCVVASGTGATASPATHVNRLDPIATLARAAGVDVTDAVVQRGTWNYAGPDCPGTGWSCTSIGRRAVVQSGLINVVDCARASCSVVQSGTSNSTRCDRLDVDDADQTCSITQQTDSGTNDAVVVMRVTQSDSADLLATAQAQDSSQGATIDQDATAGGSNSAVLEQRIEQSLRAEISVPALKQTQEAHVDGSLKQSTAGGAGNNSAVVTQWVTQQASADVNVLGVTQEQNKVDDGPNIDLFFRQTSDLGDNDAAITQANVENGSALTPVGPVVQHQGSPDGGLRGDVDQIDNGGDSNYDLAQRKWWNLHALKLIGAVTQLQDDLELCCVLSGAGRTPDTCTIEQLAQLTADAGANQSITQIARAFAKQTCTLTQTASINGQPNTYTESGPAIDHQRDCAPGTACTETERALSRLFKAVRNESDEEVFGTGDTDPENTNADPGEVVEYRLTYRNIGAETAHGVTVDDTVPANHTFLSCTGGCTAEGTSPGSDIGWTIGDVAGGGSAVVTFRAQIDESFPIGTTDIPNVAHTESDEESRQDSNRTKVWVTVEGTPSSSLNKQVRNENRQVELPPSWDTSANADNVDTLEFRLVYSNGGDGEATGVTLTDDIDDSFTFIECTGGCVDVGGPSDVVLQWDLGTVEAGGTRTVTYRLTAPSEGFGNYPNVASVSSDQEDPAASNVATVLIGSCFSTGGPEDFDSPLVLDFEGFSNGTIIDGEYTSSGVTFIEGPESHPTIISADGFGRTTQSPVASLFNQNDTPTPGSVGTPMTMTFAPRVANVGMYVGNGNVTAVMTAYDSDGYEVCSATDTSNTNDVNTWIGMRAASDIIQTVTIDYGATTLGEEIDDLTFEQLPPPVL